MDLADPHATLSRIRHPGLAAPAEAPAGPTLAEVALGVEEIAAVFAVLATTLADLRDLGVALGPVSQADVILAPDGRPVIIGWASVAAAERAPGQQAAEVRNLGAMLTGALRRCTPQPASTGRYRRWQRGPRPLGEEVQRWAAAAEHGTPTLRQLADGLVHPEARLPRRTEAGERRAQIGERRAEISERRTESQVVIATEPPPRAPSRGGVAGRWRGPTPAHAAPSGWRWKSQRRWHVAAALAIVGLGLVVGGIATWRGPMRPRMATATRPEPGAQELCLLEARSGGCAIPATYAGGVIRSSTGRFAVGRPADVAAVGRWSCQAEPTLAMLRPDRGEIWVFAGWPGPGAAPVTARLATHVTQARSLSVHHLGGCDALSVTRADGTSVVVDASVVR